MKTETEYTEGATVAGPALPASVAMLRALQSPERAGELLEPDMPHTPARVIPRHQSGEKSRSAIVPAGHPAALRFYRCKDCGEVIEESAQPASVCPHCGGQLLPATVAA